jgi:hypothetical protein
VAMFCPRDGCGHPARSTQEYILLRVVPIDCDKQQLTGACPACRGLASPRRLSASRGKRCPATRRQGARPPACRLRGRAGGGSQLPPTATAGPGGQTRGVWPVFASFPGPQGDPVGRVPARAGTMAAGTRAAGLDEPQNSNLGALMRRGARQQGAPAPGEAGAGELALEQKGGERLWVCWAAGGKLMYFGR